MRGPCAWTAARRLPGPESLRLVTTSTLPPRPPGVPAPAPSAPGNAGIFALVKGSAANEFANGGNRKATTAKKPTPAASQFTVARRTMRFLECVAEKLLKKTCGEH